MARPTLTLALRSVLTARVEGERRTGLLAVLRPDFSRSSRPAPSGRETGVGDGTVIPLPRVIPLPTRPQDDDPPDSAA